jgi:predicted DNA-binding protein (MmcQ/YjbR family)
MNVEEYRSYCLAKRGVTEEFPFDSDTLVFKVMGKMFALTNIATFSSVNLKCDPEKAVELRDRFNAVTAGYHMNKRRWNTIFLDGSISEKHLKAWIDDSYNLVVISLPKKDRLALEAL